MAATEPLGGLEDPEERSRKIKLLRTSTGRGSMECYNALLKANGDVQEARDILNSAATSDARPSNRPSTGAGVVTLMDGRVAVARSAKFGVLLELRCATDFVARSQMYINFCNTLAQAVLKMFSDNPEATRWDKQQLESQIVSSFETMKCVRCNHTLSFTISLVNSSLKESMAISRIGFLRAKEGEILAHYVHGSLHQSSPLSDIGSSASLFSFSLESTDDANTPIGIKPEDLIQQHEAGINTSSDHCCLVSTGCNFTRDSTRFSLLQSSESDDKKLANVKQLVKHLTMHIIGNKPKYISMDALDPQILTAAKEEITSQLPTSNMKPEIIERIIAGKLDKKFGDAVLLQQEWAFGSSGNVAKQLESFNKQFHIKLVPRSFLHASMSDDLLAQTSASTSTTTGQDDATSTFKNIFTCNVAF